MNSIYFDHAATTPVHPQVLDAMLPFYREHFGNPSSMHAYGQTARIAVSQARDRIAEALRCKPSQIVFTSGGTESDNMALFGVAAASSLQTKHIITSQIEHHAVLHACRRLEKWGCEVTYVPVDEFGQVSVCDVEAAIRPDTVMISIMYGNNEIGTLQPIEQVGTLARGKGICFHVDAVQALGMVDLDLASLPVDLMSFSAHKINGPKGIGALYIGQGVRISPYLYGGSQERNRRAGTENVAGIVGFAKAVEMATERLPEKRESLEQLRQLMIDSLVRALGEDGFAINGHLTERLPHILNVSFPGIDTETMLMSLDLQGVAAASGSACSSGSLEISHVLEAMGLQEAICRSAIRFSFGFGNTSEEVKKAARIIATIGSHIRK